MNAKCSYHPVHEISRSSFIEELSKCHLDASGQLNRVASAENKCALLGDVELQHILNRNYLVLPTPSSCDWLALIRVYVILKHTFVLSTLSFINPDCLCLRVVYFEKDAVFLSRHLVELEELISRRSASVGDIEPNGGGRCAGLD